MFQICGYVDAVSFPVQNVYKMTYGDENATFEPVNGYLYLSLCQMIACSRDDTIRNFSSQVNTVYRCIASQFF